MFNDTGGYNSQYDSSAYLDVKIRVNINSAIVCYVFLQHKKRYLLSPDHTRCKALRRMNRLMVGRSIINNGFCALLTGSMGDKSEAVRGLHCIRVYHSYRRNIVKEEAYWTGNPTTVFWVKETKLSICHTISQI